MHHRCKKGEQRFFRSARKKKSPSLLVSETCLFVCLFVGLDWFGLVSFGLVVCAFVFLVYMCIYIYIYVFLLACLSALSACLLVCLSVGLFV